MAINKPIPLKFSREIELPDSEDWMVEFSGEAVKEDDGWHVDVTFDSERYSGSDVVAINLDYRRTRLAAIMLAEEVDSKSI